MSRARFAAAIAAVVVLGATGCSSSRDDRAQDSATSTSAPGASTTSTTGAAAASTPIHDTDVLKLALLTRADFPKEWKQTAAQPDDAASERLNREFNTCLGRPAPSTYEIAKVTGDVFSLDTTIVASSASLTRLPSDSHEDFAALSKPNASACLKTTAEAQIKTLLSQQGLGSASLSTTVTRLDFADSLTSGGFRVAARVSAVQSITVYLDFVFFNSGRIEGGFNMLGVRTPPSIEEERRLVELMGNYVDKAATADGSDARVKACALNQRGQDKVPC